jgi:hypothetical protein
MKLKCDNCGAEFKIEIEDEVLDCHYSCVFCEQKIFDSHKKFTLTKIVSFPPKRITVPDRVCYALDSYLQQYAESFDTYHIFLQPYNQPPFPSWIMLEVRGEKKNDDWEKKGCIRIRIIFELEDHQTSIPIIFVNGIFSHNGIGKKLISLVFDVCKLVGHRLFIVQMVESFHEKLRNRGATMIDSATVEITDNTNLL